MAMSSDTPPSKDVPRSRAGRSGARPGSGAEAGTPRQGEKMIRTQRWSAAALAAVTGVIMSAGAALAAAPGNDVSGGALAIGALPYSTTLDTTQATTDADDAELNPPECGAPATDASVWFTFTAAADGFVVADVSGSDYSAGASAGEGTPGSLTWLGCGPGGTAFP